MLYAWFPNFIYERYHLSMTESSFTATVYIQISCMAGVLAGGVLAVSACGDKAGDELNEKNKEAEITWRSFQNERGEGERAIADEWNVQGWPTL